MVNSGMTPLFRLLTPVLRTMRLSPKITQLSTSQLSASSASRSNASSRGFSTTTMLSARPKTQVKKDPRITLIRYHLQHPKTPRPLRFSRMRALRHWTIHRAWMLFRRKQKDAERLELERLYNSTHSAMEALRTLDGSGEVNGGRLYRIALEKKGVFRPGGVPIEYARSMVDTPGKEAWNHGWTR